MMPIYKKYMDEGRVLIHEHPKTATSWTLREVLAIQQEGGVQLFQADHCMYGLKTWGDHRGIHVAAQKPKTPMTNSRATGR